MEARGPTRRTRTARRKIGAADAPRESAWAGARTLAEREAAVLAGEEASQVRREAEDRREVAADRREAQADRREAATTLREQALLPREGKAKARSKARARAAAHLRRVNERLVLTTVEALTRTEAAEQVTAAMSQTAQHDCLTGLPNRALFADRLEQSLACALRQGHGVALLFLDLDHFKLVNDTLGHPAGDLLLRSIAGRLLASVRQTDTVCRLGGDEFLLLLSEIREVADAVGTARKVIAALALPHRLGAHRISVTVSIGISCFPGDGVDPEALVRAADLALYEAKRKGRDRVQVYARSLARPRGRRV